MALAIFSQLLTAQPASYNPATGKIEMTVVMARELAVIIIERDTLLERNKQLAWQLNDAIGDIDVLLNDYESTVQELKDLRIGIAAITAEIDKINEEETKYWKRLSKGIRLDLSLNSTVNEWQRLVVIPKLSIPIAGKWSIQATAVIPLSGNAQYFTGVGYRLF